MAEFTKGPWSYDSGVIPPDGPGRYATISSPEDVTVAEINDLIPEGRANAHLIAASPELYEALKGLTHEALAKLGGEDADT